MINTFVHRELWAHGRDTAFRWLANNLDERHRFVNAPVVHVAGRALEMISIRGNLTAFLDWVKQINACGQTIAVYDVIVQPSIVQFAVADPITFEPSILETPKLREEMIMVRYAVIPDELLDVKKSDVEFAPIPSYGDLLEKEHFIAACLAGGFIDYDGDGELSNGTQVAEGMYVSPSDITKRNFQWPEWATHLVWYNR